jgi:hypothetical protein
LSPLWEDPNWFLAIVATVAIMAGVAIMQSLLKKLLCSLDFSKARAINVIFNNLLILFALFFEIG